MVKIKKKDELIRKIRKIVIILMLLLVFMKINKTLFFLVFFYIGGFIGKWIRGQFGLKLIVLDPSLFFMILITKFLGIKMLAIFLFFSILLTDILTNIFTAGSFLNYVIYHIAPIVGVTLFGNFSMMVYGNVSSLLYSVLYLFGRTFILPDAPYKVIAKAITSFIFTFLYISFFGPLFQLLMS